MTSLQIILLVALIALIVGWIVYRKKRGGQ